MQLPDSRTLTPSEIFHIVAPNEPLPASIAAAESRHSSPAGSDPHPEGAPIASASQAQPAIVHKAESLVSSSTAVTAVGCDFNWFVAASSDWKKFCPTSAFYTWCMADKAWATASSGTNGTDRSYATTCADIGNMTMSLSSGRGGGTWTVLQGTWRQAFVMGALDCNCFPFHCTNFCNFTADYAVSNGGNFHFGGAFDRLD